MAYRNQFINERHLLNRTRGDEMMWTCRSLQQVYEGFSFCLRRKQYILLDYRDYDYW